MSALQKELITLLIAGVSVLLLIKFSGLKLWHAVLLLGAGIYLEMSVIGPQISRLLATASTFLGHAGH